MYEHTLIFVMKKLVISLLVVMFLVLIGGSMKLISADHLEPGLGIFKNEREVNNIWTEDSKYQIYLTVEIRNAQGELISISDAMRGKHIAHEITDSILILIFGTIIASPILVTFTYHYEVLPYRFVPLIIFFAIGVGLFFSKRSVNLE